MLLLQFSSIPDLVICKANPCRIADLRQCEITMGNVFLLYMPRGNEEAMEHYTNTIVNRVPLGRITPHVSTLLRDRLIGIFGEAPMAVWGSAGGPGNRR